MTFLMYKNIIKKNHHIQKVSSELIKLDIWFFFIEHFYIYYKNYFTHLIKIEAIFILKILNEYCKIALS